MACISAYSFCLSHYGCHDEDFLVQNLSAVQLQITKRLAYFDNAPTPLSKPTDLLENVERFIEKLSTYLNLPMEICYDLFVHFLATYEGESENSIQICMTNGRMELLLKRIRAFYWQERLSLIGLLRLAMCTWHPSWSSLADVLFAMTPFASRDDLINAILQDYSGLTNKIDSQVKELNMLSTNFYCHGLSESDSADDSEAFRLQSLKEQLELLYALLVGVHALFPEEQVSEQFSKFLETFWTISFGTAFVDQHRLIEKICFTQTCILIRLAHLDASILFSGTSGKSERRSIRDCKAAATEQVASPDFSQHFLSSGRLCNRLMAALSGLGDWDVHGPLLLFGSVCGMAFHKHCATRDESVDPNVAVANQFAMQAIKSLRVFSFLDRKLTGCSEVGEEDGFLGPVGVDNNCLETVTDVGLVGFCQHVAIFDLLSMMACEIVLWSLDPGMPFAADDCGLLDIVEEEKAGRMRETQSSPLGQDRPNRRSFISIYVKTLRVVAEHPELAARCGNDPKSGYSSTFGPRVANIIETLTECFPIDLSVLRLCSALLSPAIPGSTMTDRISSSSSPTTTLVSDLITGMPYVAEPLSPELVELLSSCAVPCYPQLTGTDNDDETLDGDDRLMLSQPRSLLSTAVVAGSRQSRGHATGGGHRNNRVALIWSGVHLPAGTEGRVKSDLNLIVWRQEYCVWSVAGHELQTVSDAMDRVGSLELQRLRHPSTLLFHGAEVNAAPVLTSSPARPGQGRGGQAGSEAELVTCYHDLHRCLLRVCEFLRFALACVQAQLSVPDCLHLADSIWSLALRYLQLRQQITGRQDSTIFTIALLRQPTPSESSRTLVDTVVFDTLLPCLLRVFSSVWTNQTSGTAAAPSRLLSEPFLSMWTRVLEASPSLFPRVVTVSTGDSVVTSPNSLMLTPSILKPHLIESVDARRLVTASPSWRLTNLLTAYQEFCYGLFMAVKSHTPPPVADGSSGASEQVGRLRGFLYHCLDCLKGCLLLTVQQVLPSLGVSLSRLADSGCESEAYRHFFMVAEHSLLLLSDVVTTRVPGEDERIDVKDPHEPSDCSSPLLLLLSQFASDLLTSDAGARPSVDCLLTLSSLPVDGLVKRLHASDHGLIITEPLHNASNYCSCRAVSAANSIARVAWLAVTIVYHLLGVDQRRRQERAQHQSQKLDPAGEHQTGFVLSCLRSRLQPIGWPCGSYIPALFAYLRYPYNPGLTRAALTLLKWLIQFTQVDLFSCLDHHSRQSVRTACLSTLTCSEEEEKEDRQQCELTRAALFDLLAEVVLCHRRLPNQRDSLPPFLRLLLSQSREQKQRQTRSVGLVGGLLPPLVEAAVGQKLSVQPDCFECCLAVLRQAKKWFKEEECFNSVRLTLLCNVVKLVAAVFLQDIKVGINVLKSNSSFWKLLVGPIGSLIDRKAGKGVGTEMSNVENELCGQIASVLGLELFSLLYVYKVKRLPAPFERVLDDIGSTSTYASWFKLVSRSLKDTYAGVKAHLIVGEDLRTITSRVTSLYEATCRWKCLLLLHLRHLDREADPETFGGRLADEAFPLSAIVDSIIDALSALIQFPLLPVARDLGNQLATCLTVVLLRMPSSRETGRLAKLVRLLCCLQDLALGAATPISGIAGLQHMHADLLACCTCCYRLEQSTVVTPSADAVSTTIAAGVDMSADITHQQEEQLLDSALFYLRQAVDAFIEAQGAPAPAVEAIANQSIGLLLTLCESSVASHWLCCLLAQSGVLNNLLIVLQMHSKSRNGAALCNSIFSLLLHLVIRSNSRQTTDTSLPQPSSPCTRRAAEEMTELDHLQLEPVGEEEKASSTQIIASYSDLLVQAMQWPSVDTLMRWIQEDDSLMSSTGPGAWSRLLRTQLYLLLALHDNLGGLGHPRVDQLVHGFWSVNSTQLESLLERWWICCCQRLVVNPPLVLPPTCLLVSEGFLPASRLSLAECIAALLWRLSTSQFLGSPLASTGGGGGVKPVAFGLLFRDYDTVGRTPAFHPTYGPCYSPQIQLVIFQLALRQIAWCGILFQRPGFKSSTATAAAAGAGNPTQKSIGRSQTAAVSSPDTKDSNSAGLKSKSLQVGHSELDLLPLVRHLITALAVVACHLPMLGELSFLTTEELRQMYCPVQLVFSTPGLEDQSSALTFGGLLCLTHSLGHLSNRVTTHHKSSPTGSQRLTDRRRQLGSLLTRAREMTLGIILSQAISVLASEQTSTADKHLLVRELSSELKSCLSLPRSGARRSASLRSSRSPSSGRSSSVATQQRHSPTPLLQTSGVHPVMGTGAGGAAPVGTPGNCEASILRIPLACPTGHSPFGFLQAVDRFTELLRTALQ